MTLLQAVNGMTDVVFGIKDLITIGGGIVATVTAYLTLKFTLNAFQEATNKEFKEMKKNYDEKLLNIKHGKNAIKRELTDKVDSLEVVMNKRVDKTQERMEGFQKENQVEFKDINGKLNQIIGLLEKK